MNQAMKWVGLLGLIVLLTLSVGCVSNKKFQDTTDSQSARIDDVEGGVEANERRIDELRTEVDSKIDAASKRAGEAMSASEAAMKAARAADAKASGKVLWSVTLSNEDVKFDLDKAVLTAQGKATLDNLVGKVKSLKNAAYVEIAGHTDSTGGETYNMELGLKRAVAVRTYLNDQGIALHMISVISYGETKPVADNSTKEGRAQNRRVVVKVLE